MSHHLVQNMEMLSHRVRDDNTRWRFDQALAHRMRTPCGNFSPAEYGEGKRFR
jgi:hypothetical protein